MHHSLVGSVATLAGCAVEHRKAAGRIAAVAAHIHFVADMDFVEEDNPVVLRTHREQENRIGWGIGCRGQT